MTARHKTNTMDAAKLKALQAAGWKSGDAADFLEMSDEERQLLDARVQLALAIRRQRKASNLSQKQLGAKLKTSQPRIAKIEQAANDVSLDQLVQAFSAAGGKIEVKVAAQKSKATKSKHPSASEKIVVRVTTSN
ncbi:MAG: XRE family transcriptional regulator [Planctomycetaceae bacterium]